MAVCAAVQLIQHIACLDCSIARMRMLRGLLVRMLTHYSSCHRHKYIGPFQLPVPLGNAAAAYIAMSRPEMREQEAAYDFIRTSQVPDSLPALPAPVHARNRAAPC